MNNKSRIIGTGSYLPERILTNKELAKTVETSDSTGTKMAGLLTIVDLVNYTTPKS